MLGIKRFRIRRRVTPVSPARPYRWKPHLEGLEDRYLLAGLTPVNPGALANTNTATFSNILAGTSPGAAPAGSVGGPGVPVVNDLPVGSLSLLGFTESLAGGLAPESLVGTAAGVTAFASEVGLPGAVIGLNNALPGADPRGGLNEGVLVGGGLMAGGFFYTGQNNGGFNNATFIGGFNPAGLNGGAFIGGPAYRGALIGGLSLVGFGSAGYDAGGY